MKDEEHFVFTRRGNCGTCNGTGTIEQYRNSNGGRCWTCHGSGGQRPLPGTYKVWYVPHRFFINRMKDAERYVGIVTKWGRSWRAAAQTFPSREKAAQALLVAGRTKNAEGA